MSHARVKGWRAAWTRRPKWARRAALIAVGAVLAVPVVTNAVLWLNVVPKLLNADSAALHYGFAWSPWPTRIRVHQLRIVGRDENVEFAVQIDEAWLRLDLWAAVSARTIKITRVRGSGVSVRALQRIDPEQATPDKVKALPPIPDYPTPPVTEAFVPGPPSTWADYHLISIDVSGIDATAKELWIDEARYQGRMHVHGSFLLRPGLELHLGRDAAVDIEDGKLDLAASPVLTDMKGHAQAETPFFNPTKPDGLAILAFFSGSLALRATLTNVEFANRFFSGSGVELHRGTGNVDVDLAFVHGVVQAGSVVALTSRDLRAEAARTRIDATLAVKASVNEARRGNVDLRTSGLSIAPNAGRARLSGGELAVNVATLGVVDLSKPPPPARYRATLTPLSGDIAVVRAYLPKDAPVELDAGKLSVNGEVSGTAGQADVNGRVEVKSNLTAHAGSRRFEGNLTFRGDARQKGEAWALAGTSVDVSDLMVAEGKDVTYGWWTHAEVERGELTQGKSPRLVLALRGGLRDIEPLFVAYGKDIGIPGWVQGLLPLPNTAWQGQLEAAGGALAVEHFHATSGTVTVLIKLLKPKTGAPSGAVKLASGPLSFGVAFSAGEAHPQLMATDAWFEHQH